MNDTATDKHRADLIKEGVNFVLGKDEAHQKLYRKEALLLKQARSLCQSLLQKNERFEATYFEAIRIAINKFVSPRKLSFKEINIQISELLKQSVRSEGVINLFGNAKEEFSLFDPRYLEEISKMKEKNLAAELLKKLIDEQVKLYQRTDFAQARKFSERMQRLMNAYRNGQLTNADVIEELKKLAHDIVSADNEGKELGLSKEELAFYHTLTNPLHQKDYYTNDQLKAMTQELTETMRKKRTVDFSKRSDTLAAMRMAVRKLLKKYKYPPEGEQEAIEAVLTQCEKWDEGDTDDNA
jgi:type I restriction enzyme R subunit